MAAFLEILSRQPFRVIGRVSKATASADILALLTKDGPEIDLTSPESQHWIRDMAEICGVFADILEQPSVGFCLGTERGCSRYHVDNVPMRLLVTYAGTGTEWLPESAADRDAWASGGHNDQIVIDPAAKQFLNPMDIAIFRGGEDGVLHRTPDDALSGQSILMRLDNPSFWDNIQMPKMPRMPRARTVRAGNQAVT